MKKLPIGIQTFKNIINENYYYVDKTFFIQDLVDKGKYYFLSRPRRFGKSLFLSTLKAAFSGEKVLFQGRYLEHNWDWDLKWPVIHISFGAGVSRSVEDIRITFDEILYDHARENSIDFVKKSLKGKFAELISSLYEKYGRHVVVLIDEYDKPILDNIHETETAVLIREELKNIYSVIKDADPYIKFVFITGVSKFSKVSLFSGLNNLEDITLAKEYSAICGYTQQELETVFAERLQGVNLNEVRKWYNGYNWLGEEVYNPFNVLLYLKNREFRNYWFETATPTFLIKLLEEKKYFIPGIENIKASESIIGSFDIDRLEIETLLFQTGYLTIKDIKKIVTITQYRLGYPNLEVKQSLTDYILYYLTSNTMEKENNKFAIFEALTANDMNKLEKTIHAFFASIPNDWYRKNRIANYEGYYASIVYCYFASLGLDVIPEDTTNHGRIDLTVHFDDRIYLIEFKVVELTEKGSAMKQIKARKYHQKYSNKNVYLIGIEFSRDDRNIVNFEWELIKPS
jgi:Holliday junction resolvase-like predicted endonuclease